MFCEKLKGSNLCRILEACSVDTFTPRLLKESWISPTSMWPKIIKFSNAYSVHGQHFDRRLLCSLWLHLLNVNIVKYYYYLKQLFSILICSAAGKFVNPLEFSIFLHKYDPKHNQIFAQVLKVDKENPIIFFVIYLFRKMIQYCISVSGKSMWISWISI